MSHTPSLQILNYLLRQFQELHTEPSLDVVERLKHILTDDWSDIQEMLLSTVKGCENVLTKPSAAVMVARQGRPIETVQMVIDEKTTVAVILDRFTEKDDYPLEQLGLRLQGSSTLLERTQEMLPLLELKQGEIRSNKRFELVPLPGAKWHLLPVRVTLHFDEESFPISIEYNVNVESFLRSSARKFNVEGQLTLSDGETSLASEVNLFDYVTEHPLCVLKLRNVNQV